MGGCPFHLAGGGSGKIVAYISDVRQVFCYK